MTIGRRVVRFSQPLHCGLCLVGLQWGLTNENHSVVFVILMTGRMIWKESTLKDANDTEFINHPSIPFRSTYGVAKDAQKLLSRVLTYDSAMRIDLDTFYDEVNTRSYFPVPRGMSSRPGSQRSLKSPTHSPSQVPTRTTIISGKKRSSLLRPHAALHSALRSEYPYRQFARQSTAGKRLVSLIPVALPGKYAAASADIHVLYVSRVISVVLRIDTP